MPYADRAVLLDQLAEFLKEDVRSALPQDESFVRAQVGSTASTLQYLSLELARMGLALERQESALVDALASIESERGDFEAEIAAARDRLEMAPAATGPRTIREREQQLLVALDELLSAADELPPERARTVRRHLYEVLDERVDVQLLLLRGELTPGGEEP